MASATPEGTGTARKFSRDLVVYASGGSRNGHIGMVVKARGGRIYTIEGNLSDSVKRRSMKAWDPGITGFIAPV